MGDQKGVSPSPPSVDGLIGLKRVVPRKLFMSHSFILPLSPPLDRSSSVGQWPGTETEAKGKSGHWGCW